jgi:hypothetical protein
VIAALGAGVTETDEKFVRTQVGDAQYESGR